MAADTTVDEQVRILTAGAVDVVDEADLRRKLDRDRPLRVKLGIDPTASDLHLGFAVVLQKLRQFQDLGHVAVLIIGDFTARVGDPSGRSRTRPPLSADEVEAHARTYLDQVTGILDPSPERLEVRHNADWLGNLDLARVLELAGSVTVAQILERNDFSRRYAEGSPIALSELLYPLLQGRDSVEVHADVELGGTDQLFNNLVGRTLQSRAGQEPQVVLTTPLLEGLDGVEKMSKSLGNYIGVAEPPAEQFGKVMRIPDELLGRWAALVTRWGPDRVEEFSEGLDNGDLAPVDAKRMLGRRVVELYHGAGAAEAAEAEFDTVFRDHAEPNDMPEVALGRSDGPLRLAKVLADAGLVASNKEGRRMIEQGAVRLDGERVDDAGAEYGAADLDGRTVQVGRRRWARLRVPD
ncbi:MAG: tyrosine--tRNA ligase [Acidimicrobiia bacterium]